MSEWIIDIKDEKVKQRLLTNYNNWKEWSNNSVKVVYTTPEVSKEIIEILHGIGLVTLEHYQISRGEIRFRNQDDIALALLAGLEQYKATDYV